MLTFTAPFRGAVRTGAAGIGNPPVVVFKIFPFEPATNPVCALIKLTPLKFWLVKPVGWEIQFIPPFVVLIIQLPCAEPVPVFAFKKLKLEILPVIPEDKAAQLVPLLVDFKITPVSPETYTVFPIIAIPESSSVVPDVRLSQLSPELVVRKIKPSEPVTNPVLASENLILFRNKAVPLAVAVQFTPLFIVLAITPPLPQANPVFASIKYRLLYKLPGGVCACQLAPPLVVLYKTPSPQTNPVTAFTKKIPYKWSAGTFWLNQFAPPFVVLTITPERPAALPVFASIKCILFRFAAVPLFCITH